jgi:NCS1 family nucleobase:cation symporter-1
MTHGPAQECPVAIADRDRRSNARAALSVESHSIDFVPLDERYGTPTRLFTIWFSINLSIVCAAVGTLGPAAGLSLGWTILGVTIGNALGTVIMAAHSAQGPSLGIPQMIQSRAQFGVLGAALPLAAVVLAYTLYTAADGLLVEGSIAALLPLDNTQALVLFGAVTLIIAYIGYELIHRMGAILAITSAILFTIATYLFMTRPEGVLARTAAPTMAAAATVPVHVTSAAFMLMITQAAAWTFSFGPYVADYSRYLPPTVRASTTFWYTGLGCFLGTTLVMSFGGYIAAIDPALGADPGAAMTNIFGPARPIAQLLLILGVLQGNVMNLYSAYMSSVSIFSGIQSMQRVGHVLKLVLLAVLITAATAISIEAHDAFQTYFADILSMMIYMLVPWSAINLADYYLVRHGRYVIDDMFRSDGQYRAVRWDTIGIYLFSIACQGPFMSLSFFKGPVAHWLGADFAWLPGLLVPAVLFVARERRVVGRQTAAAA